VETVPVGRLNGDGMPACLAPSSSSKAGWRASFFTGSVCCYTVGTTSCRFVYVVVVINASPYQYEGIQFEVIQQQRKINASSGDMVQPLHVALYAVAIQRDCHGVVHSK
jgi:hypothetical protein